MNGSDGSEGMKAGPDGQPPGTDEALEAYLALTLAGLRGIGELVRLRDPALPSEKLADSLRQIDECLTAVMHDYLRAA